MRIRSIAHKQCTAKHAHPVQGHPTRSAIRLLAGLGLHTPPVHQGTASVTAAANTAQQLHAPREARAKSETRQTSGPRLTETLSMTPTSLRKHNTPDDTAAERTPPPLNVTARWPSLNTEPSSLDGLPLLRGFLLPLLARRLPLPPRPIMHRAYGAQGQRRGERGMQREG